jgi:hypothetical protein
MPNRFRRIYKSFSHHQKPAEIVFTLILQQTAHKFFIGNSEHLGVQLKIVANKKGKNSRA